MIGVKTIHIRTSTNDTKRATVAMTIAADGTVLPSTIVFKGKANGWIAQNEFATYNPPLMIPGQRLDGRGGNDRMG